MTEINKELISVFPNNLSYGIISCGFIYQLKIIVKNNSSNPVRIRININPLDPDEGNHIRLVHMPSRISPGISIPLVLELTAEYPMIRSSFQMNITHNLDDSVITRFIDSNIVTVETFKHVKKSYQLQKINIFRSNVSIVGTCGTLTESRLNGEANSMLTAPTTASNVILDQDDIDDMRDLPIMGNLFWDPFEKCLRLDPTLGKVYVGSDISLQESIVKTNEQRKNRMLELEELGFHSARTIAQLSETIDSPSKPPTRPNTATTILTQTDDGNMSVASTTSRSVLTHNVSVSSLLAMKRDKKEKDRRATILSAEEFNNDADVHNHKRGARALSVARRQLSQTKFDTN
eukprot:gene7840-10647_t